MNIYPYVYRVDHPSGEFYIGYRSANRVPAESDLGHKYKTSSKYLSHPFEEYSITILAEFYLSTGKTDAYDFEQALIFEHWGDPRLVNKACHHGNKRRWSTAGKIVSAETRQKLSEAKVGKPRASASEETKRKVSDAMRGKAPSAEHRRKLSEAKRGKTHSVETKQKMAEAMRGRKHSAETRQKMSESSRRRMP